MYGNLSYAFSIALSLRILFIMSRRLSLLVIISSICPCLVITSLSATEGSIPSILLNSAKTVDDVVATGFGLPSLISKRRVSVLPCLDTSFCIRYCRPLCVNSRVILAKCAPSLIMLSFLLRGSRLCVPKSAYVIASIMLVFPAPLGPTIAMIPRPKLIVLLLWLRTFSSSTLSIIIAVLHLYAEVLCEQFLCLDYGGLLGVKA